MSVPDPSLTMTSTLLLEGLRNQDHAIWRQYVGRYQPLLLRYCRKLGLGDADADDVAQQTLIEFSKSFQAGKYDREKGRLRHWLFGIAHNQIRNWKRRRPPDQPVGAAGEDSDLLAKLGDDRRMEEYWEEEWRSSLMAHAMELVRSEVEPRTWQAFQQFALAGRPAEEVGSEFGLTANAIFSAKRRILRRLRERLADLEENW